jgi:hypothetical protein
MRFVLALALFVASIDRTCFGQDQGVSLRVIDGHNGRPIGEASLFVIDMQHQAEPHIKIKTDAQGLTTVHVHPDTILRISAEGYVLCAPKSDSYSIPISNIDFPVSGIVSKGRVGANSCGQSTAVPVPSQITLFFRPLHWWEKLHD